MQVRDGMTELMLTVGPAHSLRQAAQQMTERGVGAALVIDEESPAPGIVSERDVMKALAAGSDPDEALVADHMSDSLIVAAPDWSLERAALEMSERHIRHLIVVDGGEPVGVLSIRDIVRVWTSDGATSAMTSPEQERAG